MGVSDKRKTGRRRRRGELERSPPGSIPAPRGLVGGQYRPLDAADLKTLDDAARSILVNTGMSAAPDIVVEVVTAAGGHVDADGRLRYSASLIERALDAIPRSFALCGRDPSHDLQLDGPRVHVGSGGAAPLILDPITGRYRDSTLQDLYDAARLVDRLDNIHFFSRSMVARDMPDLKTLDINTAYACLAGTKKHVFAAASEAAHVGDIADMCHVVAGSKETFEARPFLSLNCNVAVPPLRFDPESCAVAAEAARQGIPLHVNTFGQMGASSPVTLAGSIAQTVAETLGGMIFAWLINPEAKLIFGTRTMLTDLRTGAMSGGSPEGAVAMAACAQMGNYYGFANSTIAGATDSKTADAQSGYEKALTVTLAAQAGSNLITQACGTQASLMGNALESYVIDNDMLGAIMKTLSPVNVNDETLALDAIDDAARGEGHFLGRSETLERMQSDFVYPDIGDRRSVAEWEESGAHTAVDVAKERLQTIMQGEPRNQIPREIDQQLRSRFDIRLPANPDDSP